MKQRSVWMFGILLVLAAFLVLPGTTQAKMKPLTGKQLKIKIEDVLARYYEEPFDITATDNGEVTIKGTVHTLYDKLRVFEIVSKIRGVRVIHNLLNVDTPTLPDDIIQSNIENELHIVRSILEPDRIKVHVDNGIVFLSGEVSFYREKLAAETVASWQKGVLGIVNNIKVLPPKKAVSDDNLRFILREVLKDQFPTVQDQVKFTVNKGVVTVTGRVHTMWEKKNITDEFSRIRGVRKVINNLKIAPYF